MNKLLVYAKKISEDMNRSFWKLGEVLSEIKANNTYEEIGYSLFKDFCSGELRCSYRTVQMSMVLYRWKMSFRDDAARKWVETMPWSYTNVYYKLINSDNWRDWKYEYNEMNNGKKFYDVMVEYKQKLKRVNCLRKGGISVDELNEFMDEINFTEDPILYLRNIRLNDESVSNKLGLGVGRIRNNTKYVRCAIPVDVYLKIVEKSKESGVTVSQEISDALTVLYRGEDKLNRVS